MKNWWNRGVSYDMYKDFATLIDPKSNTVENWVIVVTDTILGYAAHRKYNIDGKNALQICEMMLENTEGVSGYCQYIHFLVETIVRGRYPLLGVISDIKMPDLYKSLFGYNPDSYAADFICRLFIDKCEELQIEGVDKDLFSCIKYLVTHYRKSESMVKKFPTQILILIVCGHEVLDTLESSRQYFEVKKLLSFPLEVKCVEVPEDIIQYYTGVPRRQLEVEAKKVIKAFKGTLDVGLRDKILERDLINMFLYEYGKEFLEE